jgi:tetratricopeptide (TPR) repeat protein
MFVHSATAQDPSGSTARRRGGRGRIFDKMTVLAAAGMALILHAPVPLNAQTNNDWIGKRVVQKYPAFKLRVENQVIDTKTRLETYRVEQVNGSSLFLHAAELSGWADADQVVPVERAIEYFTDYIRANPNDPFGYSMRAKIWLEERKEFDIALGDYNDAIRLNPNSAHVFNNRGRVWQAKQEYDKAIGDYNEAVRLDPRFTLAYCNRGIAWEAKQEHDRAIADFNEAIRLDPRFVYAYRERGIAWAAKQEYDKAIADFNEAIRLDPKFAYNYSGRGIVWAVKQEHDKAIADFKEYLRLDGWKGPRSVYAVIFGHFEALRDGRNDQARSFLNDAAARCDKSLWPYPVVEYLRGEINQAKLLATATDNDKMTEVRCFLGLDLIQKQEKDSALAHFRWVKEHGNPRSIEYAIALGELDRLTSK